MRYKLLERNFFSALAVFLWCLNHTSPVFAQSCNLPQAIAAILNRPENKKATWGIAVLDLQTDREIYNYNGDRFLVPASNVKLFTTAAALLKLTPNYQFQTRIYTTGKAPILDELILVGAGDPSLTTTDLEKVLMQFKNQGFQQIKKVIIDDSYFNESPINSTWEWSDLPFDYAAPVNSLILNENAVRLTFTPSIMGQPATVQWQDAIAASQWSLDNQLITTEAKTKYEGNITGKYGSSSLTITGKIPLDNGEDHWDMAIPNPDQYVLDISLNLLKNQGITVDSGKISITHYPLENITLMAQIDSSTLDKIIQKANQNSDNLYAESLRLQLGRLDPSQSGTAAIANILKSIQVDPANYHLQDGSGLSRQNLATPQSLVKLLDQMSEQSVSKIYRDSLSIAGQSGTLKRRFVDSAIAGKLQGKTGTMTGIASLSGYLEITDQQTVALSIMVNHSDQPAPILRKSIDDVVRSLYDWGNRCQTNQK